MLELAEKEILVPVCPEQLGELATPISPQEIQGGDGEDVLARINPDVIATNTLSIPWGAIAASFLGKPHVWFVREFGERDHGLKTFLPIDSVLKMVEDLSDIIVTNSEAVHRALFPNASRRKVAVVYPCVTIPEDAPTADETSYFTRTNSTKLIISASVHEGKGQQDAVLAVEELVARGRNVELVLMGDANTDYARHLQDLVAEHSLQENVKFIGFTEDPYSVMKQADIVLACSRSEAFGRATVEGMLLKKPIIATNSGGTMELVKDGKTGLLYHPGNHRELAGKIEYLIEHPTQAKRLAENAYAFAIKTFTKENFGGKVFRLLKKLKQGTPAPTLPPEPRLSGLEMLQAVLDTARLKLPNVQSLIAQLNASLQNKEAQIAQLNASLQNKEAQLHQNGVG